MRAPPQRIECIPARRRTHRPRVARSVSSSHRCPSCPPPVKCPKDRRRSHEYDTPRARQTEGLRRKTQNLRAAQRKSDFTRTDKAGASSPNRLFCKTDARVGGSLSRLERRRRDGETAPKRQHFKPNRRPSTNRSVQFTRSNNPVKSTRNDSLNYIPFKIRRRIRGGTNGSEETKNGDVAASYREAQG